MEKKYETRVVKRNFSNGSSKAVKRDFSSAPSKEIIDKDVKQMQEEAKKYSAELHKKLKASLTSGKITNEQYDACIYLISTTESVIEDLIDLFSSFSFNSSVQYRNKKCSIETAISAVREELEQNVKKELNKEKVEDYKI